ncbi:MULTISPECIES: mannose-1-phosphate guanylyltransferase/mannose-6-phosphate isomerase [unclassified Thermosynechococcus]|uniref:mannose-1-phosphate guanylyltransferase/mannose-6-phosphate isomerase n=1 Tax=unclassified Thermosynechococcus TaxID=2622553 RepID=UPI001982690C|nr:MULTISPECIES: mannose-1-phosphate guanylyltransferase/mannose-6-phosphate isomerase [unclassified Thermosynechococcus]QSF48705.1 mannose-1-phosphate guanylyltransferase/mannose-6-phosphate isomerase [Thermosynechococcus sp. TA-1]WNC29434.1 mannose-1-phosphate guanylyltransferase/mannose-6-phosphate isomerase [Thermosynechococcus sp. PKX82]
MDCIPVILSGGAGSRLWPLSRQAHPKQFMRLTAEGQSLLQQTWQRLQGLPQVQPPVVVANDAHRFLVAEQFQELGVTPTRILLEPLGRNTAPAITLAALYVTEVLATDAILLVLPADHLIQDVAAFQQGLQRALAPATKDWLVTFGITPTSPHTGYGYIRRGEALSEAHTYRVAEFVEKPDLATAEAYLADGHYLWNSGMFLFRAQSFLAELAQQQPDILHHCRLALREGQEDLDFIRLAKAPLSQCPSLSVDYGVMEKTQKAAVVPLECGWSDVGSWSSLWEVTPKDEFGNSCRGNVLLYSSKECFVHSQHRLVTLLGVDDLIVVETADAVLIAHQKAAQQVKQVVEQLQAQGRPEADNHPVVYRPWGHYTAIDAGHRFQVKRITVKPGASLSLQQHHHRAEHWIVVSGTAEVTCNGKTFLLTENESTYIPVGAVHRLANPGKIPLEMIEVQSGAYLGEDDIVRFEDRYGRETGR